MPRNFPLGELSVGELSTLGTVWLGNSSITDLYHIHTVCYDNCSKAVSTKYFTKHFFNKKDKVSEVQISC